MTTPHSYAYMLFNRLVILFLHRLVHGQGVTINRDKKLATHIHTHSYEYWINICDYLTVGAHLNQSLLNTQKQINWLTKNFWNLFVHLQQNWYEFVCFSFSRWPPRKFDFISSIYRWNHIINNRINIFNSITTIFKLVG